MGSYGEAENLDEYDDDFIDDDDGGDVRPYRYADEEDCEEDEYEEVEEVEEETVSEEALKLLNYRQKLKEQLRSKLRKENGGSSREARKPLPLNNFGSFFGPSKPVIADRVIQESKALLETRHLAPKASKPQNNGKVSMPSSSGAKNGVRCQPSTSQVKSKSQIIKQTRDYSFLLSDDADVPKPSRDSGHQRTVAQKHDARPAQASAKSNGQPSHSGRKVVNGHEQRKSFGSPQVSSTCTAPVRKLPPDTRGSVVSSDSKMQLDLRKQAHLTKQMGSGSGNGSVRPPARSVPAKRPLSSTDKRMNSGFTEKKVYAASTSKKALPVPRHSAPNGQRMSAEKLRTSSVTKSLEHKRVVQQSSDNRVLKKENLAASKFEKNPPKHGSHRVDMDRDRARVQKPHGQLSMSNHPSGVSKGSNAKKRRAEEDDNFDYRSEIWKIFGPRKHYKDADDDDDDMCMEAGFGDIQREEMRSARIAKQEDDEELEKILEEERQERLRKKARMQKMSQR